MTITDSIDQTLGAILASEYDPNLRLQNAFNYHIETKQETNYRIKNLFGKSFHFGIIAEIESDSDMYRNKFSVVDNLYRKFRLGKIGCFFDDNIQIHCDIFSRLFGGAYPQKYKAYCEADEMQFYMDTEQCPECGGTHSKLHMILCNKMFCKDCGTHMTYYKNYSNSPAISLLTPTK